MILAVARRLLPEKLRRQLVELQRRRRLQWPRSGNVDYGDFARTSPISRVFGLDRGQPIDRYYIEKFLEAHRSDIRGRCLEMGDATYIHRFGTDVGHIDIMHYVEGNPDATIVGDLTDAPHIPSNTFDCIIFTQSLQMIYDLKAALRTLYRILAPGGVVLITSAGISKIARRLGEDDWGEYWHLTTQSASALMDETFPEAEVRVASYGNVLSTVCYLHGLAAQELPAEKLDHQDRDFEMIVTIRAQKQIGAITDDSTAA